MRKAMFVGVSLAVFAASAAVGVVGASTARHFTATLRGENEVPPVDTQGVGKAVLFVSQDGSEVRYVLVTALLEDIMQAHIHCGDEGVNGPVVAFLFGPVPDGVTKNGVLAHGTLTEADVIPRPDSAACPGGVANLEDLIQKIEAGQAYVNVHTVANQGGEIRGELN